MNRLGVALVLGVISATSPALADDWTAAQLRGDVFVYGGNQWRPLERGGVVPDGDVVKTMAGGRVTFTRGKETLDLGPNTQIQIQDRGTAVRPSTTVTEFFGSVSVEAQVENVQHFEVRTALLAAVVKGTKFTVVADKTRASVSVQRGHVAVTDAKGKSHVLISIGQSATVDRLKGWALTVAGIGKLPEILTTYGPTHPEALGTATGQQTDVGDGGPAESSGAGASGNSTGNSGEGKGNGGPNGKHASKG